MHVLEDDGVAIMYPMVAQRLLVVHERQAVERDDDLVGRHAALDLAERLEVLQLQLLAHVEDEDAVVAERRHRHLHRALLGGSTWGSRKGLMHEDTQRPPRPSLAVDGRVPGEGSRPEGRRGGSVNTSVGAAGEADSDSRVLRM